jgi:hypothetical protein
MNLKYKYPKLLRSTPWSKIISMSEKNGVKIFLDHEVLRKSLVYINIVIKIMHFHGLTLNFRLHHNNFCFS